MSTLLNGLFTTAQIAAEIDKSYDYTRKLINERGLHPVATVGRNKFYNREQLEQMKGQQ